MYFDVYVVSAHLHKLLLRGVHAGAAAQVETQPLVQAQRVVLRLIQHEAGAGGEPRQGGLGVGLGEGDAQRLQRVAGVCAQRRTIAS